MTHCRDTLAGPRARRGVIMLVVAVLSVQFGLIQHVIDAGPQHADVTCEICVAGDHHSPLVVSVARVSQIPIAAPPRALHPVVTPATRGHAAHRVRGPPRNV